MQPLAPWEVNVNISPSEAFSGTRSGLDVGSIKLFDTTDSTTSSTGALIVGGGAGIGLNLYVGANLDVNGGEFMS